MAPSDVVAAIVAVIVVLSALACPARAEVLRFTTPLYDAWGDSLPCTASIAPVGELHEAQLWQLATAAPDQRHHALAPGARDSFVVHTGGEQRTYYVRFTKRSGVPACPSPLVTLNGRLAVDSPATGAWLGSPRPNPTSGLVAVSLCLPQAGAASLEVHDVAGRRVARLLEGVHAAGVHVALWDARHAASGVYLITARRGSWSAVRRVLVLR